MIRKNGKWTALLLTGAMVLSLSAGCGKKEPEEQTAENTEKQSEETVLETETEPTEMQTEEPDQEPVIETIYSDGELKDYGSVVVIGDSAYELFTYRKDTAGSYADTVNRLTAALNGTATVYDMLIPLSSGITFPDNRTGEINSTDQRTAVDSTFDMIGGDTVKVDIFDTLMAHRTEYIYFRTDHHWTPLGAYYAYEDFCKAKGIEPEALDSYETIDFTGFLGSFYKDTKGDAALGQNPDTIHAYQPNCSASMHVTATDGTEYDWPVIYDVSSYKENLKYSTFIAGDNPMTVITNQNLNDQSTCVVVKESFGNAFVPFLVDHYQTIYVIDYRYWTGSVADFAKQKGASDVILLNNLSMIRNQYLVGQLQGVI